MTAWDDDLMGTDGPRDGPMGWELPNLRAFLAEAAGATNALANLDTEIRIFNSSYACVPGFRDYLARKVDQMHGAATQEFRDAAGAPQGRLPDPTADTLAVAVHCYLLGGIHDKVFGFWCQQFLRADNELESCLAALRDAPLKDAEMDVDPVDCDTAAWRLRAMDDQRDPFHKIGCVQQCIEAATRGAPAGADRVLPLLIHVLIQSRLPHPMATLDFLKSFPCPEAGHGDRAYALTTLESAVRYIEREGTRRLRAQRSQVHLVPALQYLSHGPITVATVEAVRGTLPSLAAYVTPEGLRWLGRACDLLHRHLRAVGPLSGVKVKWALPPPFAASPRSLLVYKEEPHVAVVVRTDRWRGGLRLLAITEGEGLVEGAGARRVLARWGDEGGPHHPLT